MGALDSVDHLLDRWWCPWRLPSVGHWPGAAERRLRGNGSGVEDLRPAVGEQTVADDEASSARRQLSGDRLHGVGAATGNDRDGLRTVRRAQYVDDVLHDRDEAFRHVVQRAVGEDHRVLEKATGVDVRMRQVHGRRLPHVHPGAPLRERRTQKYGRHAHSCGWTPPEQPLAVGAQLGCHSSTRLPSGSVTHPNRPTPSKSSVSWATSAPFRRSWSSIASRSRTRKFSMVCWAREPKYSVSESKVANTVSPASCRHRPFSSASRPRQSRYHAPRAFGSVARMKYPPTPSTRSMRLACQEAIGLARALERRAGRCPATTRDTLPRTRTRRIRVFD